MANTIKITIKVIMANTISHHQNHPDQSHPQSSMAAPAEEAAQLLRVKRCIFYIRDVAKTGGGLPESHFHFLLFLTWETPPKMQNKP